MRLRQRRVTVATDVAEYIKAVTPLYPNFETLWSGVLWTLAYRADHIGEPLAGSSYIAKVKLSRKQPVVTLVYKLTIDSAHITDCDFEYLG